MDPTVPTVDGLLTLGGLSIVVTAIVEIVFRAWQPGQEVRSRFGPLIAFAVAAVVSLTAAFFTSNNFFDALLVSVIVAWSSMGVYSTLKTAVPPKPGE